MISLVTVSEELNESIADAMTEEEEIAVELQMVNVARLRAKIRATLKDNENKQFLLKHL